MRSSIAYSLSLLLTILTVLVSCREPLLDIPAPAQVQPITIRQAEQYYQQSPLNRPSASPGNQSTQQGLEGTPSWKWAVVKKTDSCDVIVVPIRHTQNMVLHHRGKAEPRLTNLPTSEVHIELDDAEFLFFYKDKKGTTVCEVVTYIADQAWFGRSLKFFSGRVMVRDEQMSLKHGLVFENGKLTGGFKTGSINERANTARIGQTADYDICGYIEHWTIATTPTGCPEDFYYKLQSTEAVWCYMTPYISPGYTSIYLDIEGQAGSRTWGSAVPPPTEQENFEMGFEVSPPDHRLTRDDIPIFLKCFSKVQGASYRVSIYVDQPIRGSSNPYNPFAAITDKNKVGHAFLSLTQVAPGRQAIQRVIGFYPEYRGDPLRPNVPSTFADDSFHEGGWDVRVDFQVTGDEFMTIVNYIPSYTNYNYDLNWRNCGNFATSALAQIGINIPIGWMHTRWYDWGATAPNAPYHPNEGTTVYGPSMGALGNQLYRNPPLRATGASNQGGPPPIHLGACN